MGAVVAVGVLAFCAVGLAVVLIYVVTGNHGASLSNLGAFLPLLAWGGASAVGVLGRRAWGLRSFVAWVAVTSLALCAASVGGALSWTETVAIIGGLLLAGLLVSGAPRAAGSEGLDAKETS